MAKALRRELRCDVCGAMFSTPQTLDVHKARKNDKQHAEARGGKPTSPSTPPPKARKAEAREKEPEEDDDELL